MKLSIQELAQHIKEVDSHALCVLIPTNAPYKKFGEYRRFAEYKEYGLLLDYSKASQDTVVFGDEVSVGGVSGGSCWESSDPRPYSSSNIEPIVLNCLDKLLEKLFPEITFLKYRQIEAVIQQGERSEHEYYGNSTNYVFRYVKLGTLYDVLCKIGAIDLS